MSEYDDSDGYLYDETPEDMPPKMKPLKKKVGRWLRGEVSEYLDSWALRASNFIIDYDYQIDFHNWLRDTPTAYLMLKLGEGYE